MALDTTRPVGERIFFYSELEGGRKEYTAAEFAEVCPGNARAVWNRAVEQFQTVIDEELTAIRPAMEALA
jgi:hypothetical protein